MQEKNGKLYDGDTELIKFTYSVFDRFDILREHEIFKKMISVQNIYEIRINPVSTINHRVLFFPSNIDREKLECPNVIIVFGFYKTKHEKDMTQELTEASQSIRDDYYSGGISIGNIGGVDRKLIIIIILILIAYILQLMRKLIPLIFLTLRKY